MGDVTKYENRNDTKAQAIGKTVLKLAVVSLLVGLVMS